MIWYQDLFVGDSIAHKQKKIIRKIKTRSMFHTTYLLTLSSHADNLIDIISSQVVRCRHYPTNELVVIGLAGDYEEACMLAGKILSGLYAATGDFKLKEFIQKNCKISREDGQSC